MRHHSAILLLLDIFKSKVVLFDGSKHLLLRVYVAQTPLRQGFLLLSLSTHVHVRKLCLVVQLGCSSANKTGSAQTYQVSQGLESRLRCFRWLGHVHEVVGTVHDLTSKRVVVSIIDSLLARSYLQLINDCCTLVALASNIVALLLHALVILSLSILDKLFRPLTIALKDLIHD